MTSATARFFHSACKFSIFLGVILSFLMGSCVPAQELSTDQMKGLSWRLIGPFRGGRVTAVAGISGDPKTYYMGAPGGGVWKTTNGGVTRRIPK